VTFISAAVLPVFLRVADTDIRHMDITENGILEAHPGLLLVLAKYRTFDLALADQRAKERKQAKKDQEPGEGVPAAAGGEEQSVDADENKPRQSGFRKKLPKEPDVELLERVEKVDGVPDEELSSLHGLLIAWGFLRFEIVSRKLVGYQLTNLGKQAAEGRIPTEDSSDVANEAA